MFDIEKFNKIRENLEKHNNSGKIVAISKNHPVESVLEAIKQGVYIFGENRVQEAKTKFAKIKKDNPKIELHLTGPLQSNKVKDALLLFDVFHTIDREKIAKEFSKHQHLLKDKKFFVQINTGREKSKSGIFPEDTKDFLFFLKNEIKFTAIFSIVQNVTKLSEPGDPKSIEDVFEYDKLARKYALKEVKKFSNDR